MKPPLIKTFLLLLLPFCSFAQTTLLKRTFVYDKVELLVPHDFLVMTQGLMDEKYPDRGQKPSAILTSADGDVNLVISFTTQPIRPDQVTAYKDFQIAALKKSHPDATWIGDGVKTINGKDVGYYKLLSNATDQKIYNYYFFTILEGRVLLFSFNCTEALLPQWKDTAEEMVASLKVK